MSARTLTARNLSVTIDERAIFNGVSLVCRPGTITALTGPSGSGKTTLLNCLGLLQRPSEGEVFVDEQNATHWRNSRRRRFWRDDTSFILQDYGVMEDESVAFNVTMTMSLLGRKSLGDPDLLVKALTATGLQERSSERAAHLSGGEKQRLGVARSMYKGAGNLLVDEPTASLDRANRTLVMDLFRQRADEGCTVVIATHDELVIAASDHLLEL